MQYLIHDLLKLSLEDRLSVVERLISSIRADQHQKNAASDINFPKPDNRFFQGNSFPLSK